jgi:TetR/AcrR family transcriptional regulator
MNNTKQAIFNSAIKIFSLKGYNAATMEEISVMAGVAKGTLYYHFKSKEDIFDFIIVEGMATIKKKSLEIVNDEKDGLAKLKAFCKLQLNIVNEYKDFFKVVMSQLWGDNSRNLELRNAVTKYLSDIEEYLNSARLAGLIKSGNMFLMSCNIFGAICSLALHNILMNNPVNCEEDVEVMLEYILTGIKISD